MSDDADNLHDWALDRIRELRQQNDTLSNMLGTAAHDRDMALEKSRQLSQELRLVKQLFCELVLDIGYPDRKLVDRLLAKLGDAT